MGLTQTQQAILVHLLSEGDDVPANISDASGYHRNSISRAAKPLVEKGYIEKKGHGVYRLTDDGREAARQLL
jgi:DNA-binding MarR family transcriptional regulator